VQVFPRLCPHEGAGLDDAARQCAGKVHGPAAGQTGSLAESCVVQCSWHGRKFRPLLSVPLPAARGRFETTYEHLYSKLAIALTRFESGKAQRALVESSVVPLADEQEADVRRVAGLGRVDPLLLLESLKTQYAAKVRLVEARASESIGAVRLDELIGPPIPKLPPSATPATAPELPTTTPNHSATER
jgi:hypothetical protein